MRAACSGLVVIVALASAARADSQAADEAFTRGRALMKEKHYAEACAAFEQSYQLDPQAGTLFNLADCEATLGRLAAAWNHYRELARTDTNVERRAMSERLANQLAPRVPKLVVTVKPAQGATLLVDGRDATGVVGVAAPVDLGKHDIEVHRDGFRAWKQTIDVDRDGVVTNVVVTLVPEGAVPAKEALVAPAPTEGNPRRAWGQITTISGGVLVAGGLVAGGLAYSQWQHAQTCTGCVRSSESHSAEVRGDISTALVAIGLADVGLGIYLWKTAPSSATVTAVATPTAATFAIAGRF
ncbi:MAG TPA: tetratricopeptide repeat protein [Kofleriaceae bacterium]|nr:tetratricopeptide repeat protein [Kofleriaceae bacterium]